MTDTHQDRDARIEWSDPRSQRPRLWSLRNLLGLLLGSLLFLRFSLSLSWLILPWLRSGAATPDAPWEALTRAFFLAGPVAGFLAGLAVGLAADSLPAYWSALSVLAIGAAALGLMPVMALDWRAWVWLLVSLLTATAGGFLSGRWGGITRIARRE